MCTRLCAVSVSPESVCLCWSHPPHTKPVSLTPGTRHSAGPASSHAASDAVLTNERAALVGRIGFERGTKFQSIYTHLVYFYILYLLLVKCTIQKCLAFFRNLNQGTIDSEASSIQTELYTALLSL